LADLEPVIFFACPGGIDFTWYTLYVQLENIANDAINRMVLKAFMRMGFGFAGKIDTISIICNYLPP
jgi:hypothetical protein